MNQMLAIAILAAGKGTRMKSSLPKVLHKLGGKTLVERVLDSCRTANPDKTILIIGHQGGQVIHHLRNIPRIEFVVQDPQEGTGHAVQQLLPKLKDFTGDLLVLNGDVPLLRQETLERLLQKHRELKPSVTFLTTTLEDPSGYGRVFSDKGGNVQKIVEHKDCSKEQLENCLTNSGIYCFNWKDLSNVLSTLSSNNKQKEIYLTDAISKLPSAIHLEIDDSDELMGINNKIQMSICEAILQKRLRNHWMNNGVTFTDPLSCTISDSCQIGIDVTIEPQTHLRGKCTIGDNCHLGPGTLISNSTLGNRVSVIKSVIDHSVIRNSVRIGPFAHIRPETEISDNCNIGNFVEIKKSKISTGSKINHLSYLGDSCVGESVNIGAGTITANYDGKQKHRTNIGDYTKTGANSVLVAPLILGKNVTIGAGSTITKDVPEGTLAIGRSKQLNIENWANRN